MLGWFRALVPKEERFFDLFVCHAQVPLAGARSPRGLLSGGGDVVRYRNKVKGAANTKRTTSRAPR
jgi:hypothetical protein